MGIFHGIVSRFFNLYREIQRYRRGNWGNWWNFKHGFKKTTIDFCSITKSNYKNFVSDVEFQRMHPLNKAFSGIIDNKVYLPFLFKEYKEFLPKIYFFKDEMGFLPLENKEESNRLSIDDFLSFLRKKKTLVAKHTYSEVGRGFLLFEYYNDKYRINKRVVTEQTLRDTLIPLNDYIVESFVCQHSYLQNINPSSLNSLRLLLVWSPDKQSFVLARCFQRFGCNGNVVDNLGSGNGLLAYVDVESGEYLGYGVINIEGKGEIFVENLIHPNSHFVFAKKTVPNFALVKEKTIEMMNSVSFLKFVALDVAITEDSFLLIETNSYPDPAIAQYRFGFRSDSNFQYFFKDVSK